MQNDAPNIVFIMADDIGWFGGTVKVDWPILVNLRLDPFERIGLNQSLFV